MAENEVDILDAILEEYALNNYQNYGTCENCVLCDDVECECNCPVADYDGYEFIQTKLEYCVEELLRVVKGKREINKTMTKIERLEAIAHDINCLIAEKKKGDNA